MHSSPLGIVVQASQLFQPSAMLDVGWASQRRPSLGGEVHPLRLKGSSLWPLPPIAGFQLGNCSAAPASQEVQRCW